MDFIQEHFIGLGCFLFSGLIWGNLQVQLKKQIALKQNRSSTALCGVIVISLSQIMLAYGLFLDDDMYKYLFLMYFPKPPVSFFQVLWIVIMNDLALRFFIVILKSIIAISGSGFCYSRSTSISTVERNKVNLYTG